MSEVESFFKVEIPKAFQAGVAELEGRVEKATASNDPNAAKLKARLEGIRALNATTRIQLTGEGGGDFYLNQRGGTLDVSDKPDSDPVVWITSDVNHFLGLKKLGGGQVGGGSMKIGGPLKPSFVENLKTFNSVLKLVMTDAPDLPEASLLLRLGTDARKDDPDMTLTLNWGTFQQLASGQIQAPQAFMMGLLRIEGDMSIAMRLATLGGG